VLNSEIILFNFPQFWKRKKYSKNVAAKKAKRANRVNRQAKNKANPHIYNHSMTRQLKLLHAGSSLQFQTDLVVSFRKKAGRQINECCLLTNYSATAHAAERGISQLHEFVINFAA
jgi:hypothetical protein